MKTIVIIGATGYIGKLLVNAISSDRNVRVRVLSRNQETHNIFNENVEVVVSDLLLPETLPQLLTPDCTVINLSYFWNAGQESNLIATQNLLNACKAVKISRLIHCSTAAVTGRTSNNVITEETQCRPVTEYGVTKLNIEKMILEVAQEFFFDVVILRPTSVFGINSIALKKMSDEIFSGCVLKRYIKSCLFGKRRMNLVSVENVIASIIFFVESSEQYSGDIYIISEDDVANNNYKDIEKYLVEMFNVPKFRLPDISLPSIFLKWFLIMLRRNNVNPDCCYSPSKIVKAGFSPPVNFNDSLEKYAKWYCSSKKSEK